MEGERRVNSLTGDDIRFLHGESYISQKEACDILCLDDNQILLLILHCVIKYARMVDPEDTVCYFLREEIDALAEYGAKEPGLIERLVAFGSYYSPPDSPEGQHLISLGRYTPFPMSTDTQRMVQKLTDKKNREKAARSQLQEGPKDEDSALYYRGPEAASTVRKLRSTLPKVRAFYDSLNTLNGYFELLDHISKGKVKKLRLHYDRGVDGRMTLETLKKLMDAHGGKVVFFAF